MTQTNARTSFPKKLPYSDIRVAYTHHDNITRFISFKIVIPKIANEFGNLFCQVFLCPSNIDNIIFILRAEHVSNTNFMWEPSKTDLAFGNTTRYVDIYNAKPLKNRPIYVGHYAIRLNALVSPRARLGFTHDPGIPSINCMLNGVRQCQKLRARLLSAHSY